MSFRFLKISTLYRGAVTQFERDRTSHSDGYNQILDRLCSNNFFWSDYYARHLRQLGIEAFELFPNVPSLQKAWALENHAAGSNEDLVLAQIKKINPDVIFLQASGAFSNAWVARLRESIPALRLLIGWRCSPFGANDIDNFKMHDAIFTCNSSLTSAFEQMGVPSYVLHHAFEPSTFYSVSQMSESPWTRRLEKSLVFAGSLVQAREFHLGRIGFIAGLLSAGIPLSLFAETDSFSRRLAKRLLGETESFLAKIRLSPFLPARSFRRRASLWKDTQLWSPTHWAIAKNSYPALYGNEFYRVLGEAAVCLNFHIDSSGPCAGNARLFEATGMGTCLLTDWKQNIGSFFSEDSEIVTFRNPTECIEKAVWLLENPTAANDIGKRGQRRCFEHHSFRLRAEELLTTVHKLLSKGRSSFRTKSGLSFASNSEVRIPDSHAKDLHPSA